MFIGRKAAYLTNGSDHQRPFQERVQAQKNVIVSIAALVQDRHNTVLQLQWQYLISKHSELWPLSLAASAELL